MKRLSTKPFLMIAALGLILTSVPVSISSAENGKGLQEKPIAYFGLIPLYTPPLMYEKFQPLMDYLSSNTPYRFKMRLTKDYRGIISLLQEGTIDIAFLGGVSYVVARKKIELVPMLKPLNSNGKPFYQSVIITREDKDINGIHDLKGRSFAFASRLSTSGAIVPLYHLYNNGVGLNGLSAYFHLRYHDSVVREVLKGNYDAGAVIDTIAYSYKDKGLKFVFTSEPIPEFIIVVRKGAQVELVDAVKKALSGLGTEGSGTKDWGDEIRYGFVEARDSDYDGIRRIMEELKGKGVYFRDDAD